MRFWLTWAKPADLDFMAVDTVTCSPVQEIELVHVESEWEFALENAEAIAAFWQERRAEKPALFNGAVLVTRDLELSGGVLRGETFQTDFASFYAWIWWGCPDQSVVNLFSSAVVMGADRSVVFGKMGDHTANAGRVYPPGGSLDPNDILPDGRVDLVGSVRRELYEETGLDARRARGGGMTLHRSGQKCSLACTFRFENGANTLAQQIRASLKAQEEPELEDVVVIRELKEMPVDVMPDWSQSICYHALKG